ncbi:MAG: tRNA lysidine(34) synthetase TilS [Eubacteriales bacterium]|nr:tRNA lysidine(34) synthetase TilS [Eubacteriales bacterium]
MLNKVAAALRDQVLPGDTLICALSGGADSVALTFALYLLKEKLDIHLEAAHFNHNLRGAESRRDETFVRDFCARYDIPLHLGSGEIRPGKKGLEAAAREARYAYFGTLNGKIATAHTADDNAETVLMHLIRGTGLKGLGGIAPVQGRFLRPMLNVTRREVEAFLEEYHLPHVEDSTNASDIFLRNRIRRHVMPLLKAENPKLAENLSRMAQRLREEEEFLADQAAFETLPPVSQLRTMPKAKRNRMLADFLQQSGVREPEDGHIALAEKLVFSEKPSARAAFPGGVTVARNYEKLEAVTEGDKIAPAVLPVPGEVQLPGLRITAEPASEIISTADTFTVRPQGAMVVTGRRPGDSIRLPGGTKSLKKCFIDRKIPALDRLKIPVLRDEQGILGVYSIGVNRERAANGLPAVTVRFEKTE